MFLLGMHQVKNWHAAINQVRERVISLLTQLSPKSWAQSSWSKIFSRLSYHLQNFPFPISNTIDSTYTQAEATCKTFYLHTYFECLQWLSERSPCSQGQVLQQNRWDNVAEYSFNLQHVADIGPHGYMCNRHWLLSQNSSEHVNAASASRKSQAWQLLRNQIFVEILIGICKSIMNDQVGH